MKIPPALIITYNPTTDFRKHLKFFYEEFEQIIIVDNGSNLKACNLLEQEAEDRQSSLKIIFNEENLGIATALNQGFQWAIEEDFKQIITFDQDSFPAKGMVFTLQKALETYQKNQNLAIVAPIIADPLVKVKARYPRSKYKVFFERKACDGGVLENVTSVITAGSLYDLGIYQELGPFRDDFFIDYVDTEYCLRANQRGYKIIVACDAYLNHRLGEREKRNLLGRAHYPTFHSPLRWYYISRNRIPMLKKYALHFPHWLFYEIIASSYTLIRMLFFENHKWKKLVTIFLGTRDGLRGQMGKARDEIIEKLNN
jgi:rhamnosyltransferase